MIVACVRFVKLYYLHFCEMVAGCWVPSKSKHVALVLYSIIVVLMEIYSNKLNIYIDTQRDDFIQNGIQYVELGSRCTAVLTAEVIFAENNAFRHAQ